MQTIGGQAVLEGVMMRSPAHWALAVRKPNGEIAEHTTSISSPMARHRIFRLPVIRGVVALVVSGGNVATKTASAILASR